MLDKREIDIEIARLEYIDSSYDNYAKLANLYVIRDQMQGRGSAPAVSGYSFSEPKEIAPSEHIAQYGESDFLQAVAGKNPAAVWDILDELLSTLSVVNEKAYASVLRKLRAL